MPAFRGTVYPSAVRLSAALSPAVTIFGALVTAGTFMFSFTNPLSLRRIRQERTIRGCGPLFLHSPMSGVVTVADLPARGSAAICRQVLNKT
jgi:hypothetical protein